MNERIKELMTQSGIVPIPNSTRPIFVQCPMSDMEKFAELIVRECATVVQETRWMAQPSQEQIANRIKQHFGVEQ